LRRWLPTAVPEAAKDGVVPALIATADGAPELRVIEGRRGHAGGAPVNGVNGVDGVDALAGPAKPRIMPVPDALAGLFPWGGMRLGSVVSVRGSASLLFALLSTASAAGVWSAVIGREDLGLLAAAEVGVQVRRLALVPRPGAELAVVTSALLDGMDLVALAGVERLTSAEVRRLTGRARQRGAVLLPLDDWPGADVRLCCERIEWSGLAAGYGRLRSMRMIVQATGRGASARTRTVVVDLPGYPVADRSGRLAVEDLRGRSVAGRVEAVG
jgi:hypothetical protein